MSDEILRRAEALLAEERRAVMAADFDALDEIAGRKAAVMSELRDVRAPAERLRQLRRTAERNGELLAASARGLRAVIRRLSEIRSANGPLRTYSQDGRQQTFGAARGSFERKA